MKKRSSVLDSPRLKEIRRRRYVVVRNKVLLYSLIFFVFAGGLIFLSRWKEINIQNIEISGNKILETKSIEKVIRADLAGRYLFLFPKTNFLIYPKAWIKKDLMTKFYRIKSINLVVKDTKNLEVTLSERVPSYTWCGDDLPESSVRLEESKCYFMDEGGYIFDQAPYFSGEIYFRFFGKIGRNTGSPLGLTFLPDDLSRMIAFKDNVSKMNIKPASFFVKDDGDVELYLSSETSPPNAPKILFKESADLSKIADNLKTALTAEPLQTDIEKKYSSLLYIDLRFGNKVYFKFK